MHLEILSQFLSVTIPLSMLNVWVWTAWEWMSRGGLSWKTSQQVLSLTYIILVSLSPMFLWNKPALLPNSLVSPRLLLGGTKKTAQMLTDRVFLYNTGGVFLNLWCYIFQAVTAVWKADKIEYCFQIALALPASLTVTENYFICQELNCPGG